MKKRILFLNQTLEMGGIERSLIDVLNHIDYTRFQVDLWLEVAGGAFMSQLPSQVHLITPSMNDCDGPYLRVLHQLIKRGRILTAYLRTIQLLSKYIGHIAYYLVQPVFLKCGRYDTVISYTDYSLIPEVAHMGFRYDKLILWWHGSGIPPTETLKRYARSYNYIVPVSLYTANQARNILSMGNGGVK